MEGTQGEDTGWDGSRSPDEVAQVTGVTAATIDNTSFHSVEEDGWDDDLVVPLDLGKKLSSGFRNRKRTHLQYKSGVLASWNLDASVRSRLEEGQALFGFSCKIGSNLSDEERRIFGLAINLTQFGDEVKENKVPHVDMTDLKSCNLAGATFFLTRVLFLLPCIKLDTVNLEEFVTPRYHHMCQVSGTKVWEDCLDRGDVDTFRITKTVIPWVFKMTVQFKCSLVPEEELSNLRPLLNGLQVHKAILLERTKRDPNSVDMTKKCKSLLLFHELPENRGLLWANSSFIVNTSIPKFLVAMMDKVGAIGASEAAETATTTHMFWAGHSKHAHQGGPRRDDPPPVKKEKKVGNGKTYRIRPPGCVEEKCYSTRALVV